MRVLLTTTSFQDTPGKHQELLISTGFEIDYLRGPVKQEVLIPIIEKFDGVICGDDEFSREVISRGKKGKLKVISKYGVGLDKINIEAAKEFGIPVFNTPGVNQITVAEHAFALILTYLKNIHLEYNITKKGSWKRLIGSELYGGKIGILGLGKIGKELSKRLSVFGVKLYAYDIAYDEDFVIKYNITKIDSVKELIMVVDILSIHMPLNSQTKHIINNEMISLLDGSLIIVNTSRANIIEQSGLLEGLSNNKILAYLTDVMDEEPMKETHPLKDLDNVLITPHIGSRTYQSVERQGIFAVNNLKLELKKYIK